jgi:hypothetical protein
VNSRSQFSARVSQCELKVLFEVCYEDCMTNRMEYWRVRIISCVNVTQREK